MDPPAGFLEPKKKKLADNTSDKNTRDKVPRQQPSGQSQMPEPENDADVWPLSTKPYFCVILEAPHISPTVNSHGLVIPRRLHENLPIDTVPVKIVHGGKAWHLDYSGDIKRFESVGWGIFVKDNNLKVGDACVFELTKGSPESSSIEFRVQFLKDNFPTELLEKAPGYLADNPISLD